MRGQLLVPALAALAAAVPHDKRQSTLPETLDSLGALAGQLGLNQTFDYIVVGAGTAGLAVANRLSENPLNQVAVIEAGSYYELTNPLLSSTPAGDVVFVGSSITDSNPLVDWEFVTEPQAGANNRKIHYCRGRTLGGSSARNFMIYQRPTKGSLQMWADAVGDNSYTFDNFLPYYKKSADFTPPNTAKRGNATAKYNPGAFDAAGGPLHVSYANYAQTFSGYMQGGFNEVGMPIADDFNSGTLNGVQYCASTIDPSNEKRASSEETFLRAAMTRPNLKVFQGSLAKKILFDNNKKATGVLVDAAGFAPYVLSARKEIVVSSGAFHSPQLLMVSGIGPAATLKSFNIPVLVDNPNVGQNMWDHVFAGPTFRVALETFTKLANDPLYIAQQFAGPYSLQQEGPLTNPVADLLGWEKAPRANLSAAARSSLNYFSQDWPELEYISGAGYVGQFSDLLLDQPKDGYQYATILSTLVAPLSRGTVTLASADTADLPIINPNWLTHPTDKELAVIAFKRARQAFASNFMGRVRQGNEYFPGVDTATDEQILANYANTLLTVWHAACTCAMGKANDPKAVLDSKARVLGVKGLRVVDASSFPILPPGHPQSTIYALAEKISANILTGA